MHQQSDIYAGLQDTALSEYFRSAGDKLVDESAVMSLAIDSILSSDAHLSNKALILWLINALETADNVVTADVIRKTLEIVVGYTMDDI
ncbi:TPA: two-component-system connector protein AriR [Klebsiella aerogenes]|nr:two-component-system connector protein AriR [Klebsiella aerogenes]